MQKLGRFYRDGVGFEKSQVQAYVWMNRAAAKHHVNAAREREALIRTLSGEDLRLAQQLSLEPIPEFVAREEERLPEDTPTAMVD